MAYIKVPGVGLPSENQQVGAEGRQAIAEFHHLSATTEDRLESARYLAAVGVIHYEPFTPLNPRSTQMRLAVLAVDMGMSATPAMYCPANALDP